jgi:TadE-like protein
MIRLYTQLLARNDRGTALMEFALIAPTMLLIMMGVFDLSYRAYAISTLQGAMQKAGRDSTLEGAGGATASLDALVGNQVRRVVDNATIQFTRKNYDSFTRVGQAERFEDRKNPITNIADGTLGPGECYFDENGSNTWDDGGQTGQGGARDITVYTATVSFPRLFPMYGLLGFPQTETIAATTVLRNQPFSTQSARVATKVCLPA